MQWEDLITPNQYGECAAVDVREIVRRMKWVVEQSDAELELNTSVLVNQILTFILLRQTASVHEISNPHIKPSIPDDWTYDDECMWIDWIHTAFPIEFWTAKVMEPVFGSDVRLWEREGWRSELLEYLPWWIRRSIAIVTKFDPTYVEQEQDDTDSYKKEIDPYLLDHGSSKQRKGK